MERKKAAPAGGYFSMTQGIKPKDRVLSEFHEVKNGHKKIPGSLSPGTD
jgi:hypothetical protein